MKRLALAAVALGAAALAACGPYAQLAQKLDVTARIAGDTWIAASGPGRTAVRLLLVSRPDANGNVSFAFSDLPSGANVDTFTLQGTWIEVGSGGDVTLRVTHSYVLPGDNSGARRDDSGRVLHVMANRDQTGRLVLSGDATVAGTYVPFTDALRNLGTAATITPQCAFQIPNLAVMTGDIRIIGFGGYGMSQYTKSQDFIGTVAGKVNVHVDLPAVPTPSSNVTTTIRFSSFQDFGGVTLDGPQISDTTFSSNGQMSGVLRFVIEPAPIAPSTAATPIRGSIDYGTAQPSNAIQIRGGDPTGGYYLMSVDGGFSNQLVSVDAVNIPTSAVADCLALP